MCQCHCECKPFELKVSIASSLLDDIAAAFRAAEESTYYRRSGR